MKIQEIKDTEGNVRFKLIDAENPIEEQVINLLCQTSYEYSKLICPKEMEGFQGSVRLHVVNDEVKVVFFHTEDGALGKFTKESNEG
jgi:hypothetical protein